MEPTLEQALDIIAASKDADPNLLNACIQKTNQCLMSQEGLVWALQQFSSPQGTNVLSFTFRVICYWIENQWEQIAQVSDIINQIEKILFETDYSFYDRLNIAGVMSFSRSQLLFMIHSYPEVFPNFWENALKMPNSIFLQFVNTFSNQVQGN